jgi:2,3,4,5-tetrahydropyridine-2-carboxylate N-succinyltransferase
MKIYALGLGLASKSKSGSILEVYFAQPLLNPEGDWVGTLSKKVNLEKSGTTEISSDLAKEICGLIPNHPEVNPTSGVPVLTVIVEDTSPAEVGEAYLKLHLLSHRLVLPNQTNVAGIFKVLPNIAWTNEGPVATEELAERRLSARNEGRTLIVRSVDKFPAMTDYVVPSGVRIADASRVRLGAYVGEGTTIMHEGFVNFNAGCIGPNMIEGRISAGVVVGAGSDLGGGCSTMGTLSGGNSTVISVGDNCLIGANAGLGIPLGNNCIVEAGLYVTGGAKIRVKNLQGKVVGTVKAATLSGKPNILFIRNSIDGAVEAKPIKHAIELNSDLHTNQ